MPSPLIDSELVLAIVPTSRGFGYCVLEGPLSPVDWGTAEVGQQKNAESLSRIGKLLERYPADVLVLPNGARQRRSARLKRLVKGVRQLAATLNVEVYVYTRPKVQECFSHFGARTKHEIAVAIATHVPEFKPKLPPVRKIWKSEHPRMSMFDAMALGITYYYKDSDAT